MMFLFKKRCSKKKISKRAFTFMIAAFWVYTIIWLGALLAIYYFWNVSLIAKVSATIPFIILTPAITDLFQSFEKFIRQFRAQNNLNL